MDCNPLSLVVAEAKIGRAYRSDGRPPVILPVIIVCRSDFLPRLGEKPEWTTRSLPKNEDPPAVRIFFTKEKGISPFLNLSTFAAAANGQGVQVHIEALFEVNMACADKRRQDFGRQNSF